MTTMAIETVMSAMEDDDNDDNLGSGEMETGDDENGRTTDGEKTKKKPRVGKLHWDRLLLK